MNTDAPQEETAQQQWQPLSSVQRRVVGVLIEKAKTTPESYPMTLNALTNGCNQKSNRSPQMHLSTDDVEQAIEELRELGAAAEVQGGGRVPKYRHYMYDWLGVDKVELAAMAELLLRGEQTTGELRTRAGRMEPIPDLNTLGPVLDSLHTKNLILWLTPAGRGRIVTHNLYMPEQLEKLKQQYAAERVTPQQETPAASGASSRVAKQEFEQLQAEVAGLKTEVAQLREQLGRLLDGNET